MEAMLAAKFVETEIKELLKKYEIPVLDKEILIAISVQIIQSYEDYKKFTK